ncbi:hypothetical protein FSO04_38820 [Paraburkholderia madseniana]|uniref:Uncharacterized protein n=1 Tax=Paraburkholderia madseniana TaxID=2599607 RepID=A0A6N6W399_9BURK|nr:hypothetical protein [Paraburkholderia madseniana]KAE8754579.1 hypothetical protein FSO04_38820 [Paraburkholderia madseniana]
MRLIIEARSADGDNDTVEKVDGVLAVIERPDCCLADLGLTLAEGRLLLAKVQAELISKQVQSWLSGQTHCRSRGAAFNRKDSRWTVLRTVYGKVTATSPRLWSCACQRTARTPLHNIVARPVYRSAFWPAPSVASATQTARNKIPQNPRTALCKQTGFFAANYVGFRCI